MTRQPTFTEKWAESLREIAAPLGFGLRRTEDHPGGWELHTGWTTSKGGNLLEIEEYLKNKLTR